MIEQPTFPLSGRAPPRRRAATLALVLAALLPPVRAAAAQRPAPAGRTLAAADFAWRLRALDGSTVSFADFRGRPIVLNVWATWCPPCVAELGSLAALRDAVNDDRGHEDVAFLFVAPETARAVSAFARRRSLALPFHVELDPLPASFGVRALPTTIVLDRDGRVVLHHRGAADWDTPRMRALLRELAR